MMKLFFPRLCLFLCLLSTVATGTDEAWFSVKVTGKGRPMLLIPGLSCAGQVWDGTVAHFQDRYECHVVTLAGFGGQPAVDTVAKGPMLEKVRDALAAYIRERKLERPVLTGHSLGAFMSFWIAAQHPDLAGPVIAVDGVPFFPALANPKATPESMQSLARGMRSMRSTQTAEQAAFGLRLFLRPMLTREADFETVSAWSVKSDPQAVGQALYELMMVDLRPLVASIRAPVLLIGATAKAGTPEQQEELQKSYRAQVAGIPRHEVIFAPAARHFVQYDEPDFLFREMERFLNKHQAD